MHSKDDSKIMKDGENYESRTFIVISSMTTKRFSVVADGEPYASIYERVFGPDTREACEVWIAESSSHYYPTIDR